MSKLNPVRKEKLLFLKEHKISVKHIRYPFTNPVPSNKIKLGKQNFGVKTLPSGIIDNRVMMSIAYLGFQPPDAMVPYTIYGSSLVSDDDMVANKSSAKRGSTLAKRNLFNAVDQYFMCYTADDINNNGRYRYYNEDFYCDHLCTKMGFTIHLLKDLNIGSFGIIKLDHLHKILEIWENDLIEAYRSDLTGSMDNLHISEDMVEFLRSIR